MCEFASVSVYVYAFERILYATGCHELLMGFCLLRANKQRAVETELIETTTIADGEGVFYLLWTNKARNKFDGGDGNSNRMMLTVQL